MTDIKLSSSLEVYACGRGGVGCGGRVGGILKLPPTLERDKKVLGMTALRWSDKCSIYEKKSRSMEMASGE